MVAILAVLTITVFILVDWVVQLFQAARARRQIVADSGKLWSQRMEDPLDVPMGVFFHPGHSWALVKPSGSVRVGLDGLIGFLLGRVDGVELPVLGQRVREGESIAGFFQGSRELRVAAPIDGTVVAVNRDLKPDGSFISSEPYGAGWICEIKPHSLSRGLRRLMVADQAVEWRTRESQHIYSFFSREDSGINGKGIADPDSYSAYGFLQGVRDEEWCEFQREFLNARLEGNAVQ